MDLNPLTSSTLHTTLVELKTRIVDRTMSTLFPPLDTSSSASVGTWFFFFLLLYCDDTSLRVTWFALHASLLP
jgi:hypothetical protein